MSPRELSSGAVAERVAGLYATLAEVDEAIVRVRQRLALFEQVCRVLVERGRLPLVWVGEIDADGWVVPVADAGAARGYIGSIRICVHDVPAGRGPTGTAARERHHVVIADIAKDERMAPWRDAALARGLQSAAAFPLVLEDRCLAVVTAYASEQGFFDEEDLQLFDRMAAHLSFALEAMQLEEQRRAVEARLRASEEQLRVAADSMLDSFTIISPVRDERGDIIDFRHRYVNDAYCALIGFNREQAIGHRIGELFPQFPGSDRFAVYRRVAVTGEPCRTDSVHSQAAWEGTLLATRVLDTSIASMGDDLVVSARDITERRRNEQELRLRAELLDLAHDAVIVRDPTESRVTFWNRGAEAIYGYSRAEAAGRVTHELLATVFPQSREAVDDALAHEGRWVGELRHTRKDGREILVSSRQALQRGEDGRPVAIITLNSDITERKRAEEQLAYTSRLLERTQEISRTGGWEYDLASGKLTWTDEVFRIYGVERTSEPPVAQAIAAYDPEFAPIISAAFERLVADGEPYDLELGLVRADGQRVWVRTIGRPVIEDGRVARVGGDIVDITERHRAEEEIRTLNAELEQRVATRTADLERVNEALEQAQRLARVGSWTWDPRAEQVTWSAQMYELFGRDPAAGPAVGDALLAYVHPEDRERVSERYGPGADSAGEFELEFRIRSEHGQERVLHAVGREVPSRPDGYQGTFQDVTAQRRAEQERLALLEQSTRADSANRAKSEFLARMSHELRTPLNSILGFSQLLELEGLEPRESDNVGYILKAGEHLLELVNEVLDLAQIESGQMTISPEPVALADAIRDALALLAPTARERDVSLHADTSGLADDGHVYADRFRFQQVLLNLLSNAIKYNRPSGRVDISFHVTQARRVRTVIADTGIGIQPEHQATLFEPFERLGAELTEVEGTGLGLSLSKGLIEAMGGTIEVDSTAGAGTTFVIELAEAEPPANQCQPGPGDTELAELGGPGAKRHTILYIEDNLSNLTLVSRMLERHDGIQLISAMQGTLGLELARQHHPDLIVLDLHLPDISGADVLKRLKADHPDIPVIVLTADATTRQAESIRSLGAADYLTKPIDVPRFYEAITTNLTARDNASRR